MRLFDQLTRAHELGMSGSQFERSVQAAYRQNYQQVQLKYWALCGDLNRRKRAELAADGSRHGLLQGVLQPAAQQQRQIGSGSTAGARATAAAAAAAAGGAPSASAVSASPTGAGGSRQRQGRLDAYLQPQLAAASPAAAADDGQTDAGAARRRVRRRCLRPACMNQRRGSSPAWAPAQSASRQRWVACRTSQFSTSRALLSLPEHWQPLPSDSGSQPAEVCKSATTNPAGLDITAISRYLNYAWRTLCIGMLPFEACAMMFLDSMPP